MRSRRPLAAMAALAATALTACASLPSSGSIRLSTLHGSGAQPPLGIEVVPVPPGSGWFPDQIVSGFLAASASFASQHSVARKYLTRDFAKAWKPGWAATVVASPQVAQSQLPKQVTTGGSPDAAVTVTGSYTAAMITGGKYEAGTLVASAQPKTYTFALNQVGGQWRIDGIYLKNRLQRRLLLLTLPDFQTDYEPRNLYYFPAPAGSPPGSGSPASQAPAANILIPEPVYIPEQASGNNAGVKGMVNSLLSPAPPETSWLYGAATTAFPRGTRLIGARVNGVDAVIDLGGTAAKATRAQLAQMAAQIKWSLTAEPFSSPTGNQIRSVVLQVNHRTWRQLLAPYATSWVPRGQSDQLYVQMTGTTPDIKVLPAGAAPVLMPESLAGDEFGAIAVTPGAQSQAVLAGCRGSYVYLMPQWQSGPVVSQRLPARCTSLSWDDRRNLWVSTGAGVYELPGAGLGSPTKPRIVHVVCPPLACTGTISSLRVAPDGVRAAMIVTSKSRSQVIIAAISRNPSFTYLGASGSVVSIGPDIARPVALAWLDPDHLLVVGQVGGRSQIYEVPLNGGSSTVIAPPSGVVTSITASWPDASAALPVIVVSVAQDGHRPPSVWSSKAGLLDRGWTMVAKGSTPVFPG